MGRSYVPEVSEHDNRGDSEVAFGFVYFTDGRRVTYATGHGVTGGTGGWAAITPAYVEAAKDYLIKNGIPL